MSDLKDMKMSDWFKSEIRLHGDIIECNDFAYAEMSCEYIVDDIDAGVAICHAVNNHDRLVEENAELRESDEKSSSWCVDIFNDFSESEIKSMSPSIIGAWNHGKRLLNK
ncbi:hypothetical protein [Vibrio phage H188]|nr:hypothetical protein [Vibrio phage H188]